MGKPGFPVAAVERGRRVIVGLDSSIEVGAVSFIVDIPDSAEESWYCGQIIVGVKESAFEPSSPFRHCAELCNVTSSQDLDSQPIHCLYSEGGPDHRLTYLSLQLSLIAVFLKFDYVHSFSFLEKSCGTYYVPAEFRTAISWFDEKAGE